MGKVSRVESTESTGKLKRDVCYQQSSSSRGKDLDKITILSTPKIEKICFSRKVSIQPWRPKSDSALPGAI